MKNLLAALFVLAWIGAGCGKPKEQFKIPPPQYPVLTLEILRALPDEKLEGAILDHIRSKVGEDYEHEYRIVTSLSKGFQMVYATSWVEGEVDNGGFNQYFWNPSGAFRIEALEGYKLIGATQHEQIMAEAIKVYAAIESKLKQQQEKGTLKAFSDSYKDNPLNKLDDQFYELKENVSALRVRFIREHPDLFVST
jgi:hypothetical protein